jgi:proteasome accessory factor C
MSTRSLPIARLHRMLALVPWVLAHPGATIPELAARFEVGERELEEDLELLPMCGLPPYTADRLIDVWVGDDGGVEIRLAEYFERPLRLTPAEGVTLLAAGRALLTVPGADPEGPLASALAKLEAALGARGGVAVDVGAPDVLAELQAALRDGEQVELDYHSFARDEMTTRRVDPWRTFHAFGAWYLAGYCHLADAERLFRVDRMRAVRRTGAPIVETSKGYDDDEIGATLYEPDPTDLRVTLRLEPEARWVVESHPTESVKERKNGQLDVVLAVSATAFLERLVLGLGPAASVVDPPKARELVRDAASRVLQRYGVS